MLRYTGVQPERAQRERLYIEDQVRERELPCSVQLEVDTVDDDRHEDEIETEAARTFKRHIAGRRVVDVGEPGGPVTSAVSTGHLRDVPPPGEGVVAHLRESKPLVRLRVPFTVSRTAIDDVERGSQDSDWDPVKEAAKKLAFVEDRAIFEGYEAASIDGAFVLSTRGGDFDLHLGTDVSIGYLSHDAGTVELYLQETLTFLCYTAEASVALTP